MHRFLGRILASFIVLLFNAATGVAFTVERTTTPVTKMSKTTPGGPNYGQFGYLYAPSVMTTGGNTTAWTCGGLQTDVDGFGGDHLFRKQNWTGVEDVTLCPSLDNVTPNPVACSSLWRTSTFPTDWTPRDDRSLICDPSVVKIGSTYYMYYTGDPYKGQHGQMFRAHSTDGINWVKYPNNGVPAQAVIPLGPDQYLKFGIGEPSVVYRNGTYYMWYTDFRYLHKTTSNQYHYQGIYRATSTNGTSFTDRSGTLTDDVRDRVYPPCYDCASTNYIKGIPFGNEGVAGVEVRYVSGWDVWFMVHATYDKNDMTWNISRDGIHWLPWKSADASSSGFGKFGYTSRIISLPKRFNTAPALLSNEYGSIGSGSLSPTQTAKMYYTAGHSQYVRGCADERSSSGEVCEGGYENPTPPDEPVGFWGWTIDETEIKLTPQGLYGWVGIMDWSTLKMRGWAYDPDTGVNDSAINGLEPGETSQPLGHDTWVRAIATNTSTGQRLEGPWQSAQERWAGLAAAGEAPDDYHGYTIDLKQQGFPAGTYVMTVEGGEFPTGMGSRALLGSFTVTIP